MMRDLSAACSDDQGDVVSGPFLFERPWPRARGPRLLLRRFVNGCASKHCRNDVDLSPGEGIGRAQEAFLVPAARQRW